MSFLNTHAISKLPVAAVLYCSDRSGIKSKGFCTIFPLLTGKVRRSFNGSYPPLYQAGYMLGAMQLRALYAQQVTSGKMPEREFHDTILRGGPMPSEMVRALLTKENLPRDFKPSWHFAE